MCKLCDIGSRFIATWADGGYKHQWCEDFRASLSVCLYSAYTVYSEGVHTVETVLRIESCE